ncbi:MAG: hypothetical protein KDJ31_09465 [Candidatus Competibacteraceae bacterium]|nr:hypothetical protein [Candidatus Competibacteraceae bacterium]MCB1822844.1 hypothetical protein [Candidatus Competibacteraceae bacterium]HRY16731.1 hypothetical protein [Candidatus Competibacteraceae bacterium]
MNKRQQSLRARAEALLNQSDAASLDLSPAEIGRLVHDLSVYQIELELQNEGLRHAQNQLARARDRYAQLYYSTIKDFFCSQTLTNLPG